jgi:hypothetical protein
MNHPISIAETNDKKNGKTRFVKALIHYDNLLITDKVICAAVSGVIDFQMRINADK